MKKNGNDEIKRNWKINFDLDSLLSGTVQRLDFQENVYEKFQNNRNPLKKKSSKK